MLKRFVKKAVCMSLAISLVLAGGCKSNIQSNDDKRAKKETVKKEDSLALSEKELKQIEEDFSHMEYNYFLGIEFNNLDDIDWDEVYENRQTKEYTPDKYRALSGKKLGDTYAVVVEPVLETEDADFKIMNPSRKVSFKWDGKTYNFLHNEFLWEEGCSKAFDLNLEPYGVCRFVAFYGNDSRDAHLFITADGKKVAEVDQGFYTADGWMQISDICDVEVTDYNKDCVSDILMTCKMGDKERALIFEGVLHESQDYYLIDVALSEAAEEYVGNDYSVDGIKDYLLLHNINDEDYKSYKAAYADLIDKLEANNTNPSSYLYDLQKIDDDNVPELLVQMDEEQFVYTYKEKQLNIVETEQDLEGEANYTYAEVLDKLGATKDKVTKLFGKTEPEHGKDSVQFAVDEVEYTLEYSNAGLGHATLSLSADDDKVTIPDATPINRAYLIERANGQKFLLVNMVRFCYDSYMYVFNLNGNRLVEPKEFDSKFSLFNGDITNTRSFDLFRTQTVFGAAVTYENFFIGMDGLPKTNDEIEMYASNSSIDDGNKIIKTGEKVKLKIDYTLPVGKSLEDDDEDDWKEETLPAGTQMTLLCTDETYVIMQLKDGRYTGIEIISEDDEDSEENDEEVIYLEDIFDDIPMLVDEEDIWYLWD
ncbi:hypothetical protein SAMN02910298_02187 [Pseudobutyrivibrio sp. YE44]|uniref:hypothetical protein n=1 Tax=Pseudobutyrivibrio sp. YE44 TaxID=1520802 RepID=UPI00088D48CC|nr:hypothetical protein [Pseudobutyrivibrio sp. YE44]SDB43707.1 hypothetical protein SAMN02910298_02187 [Pseudobutyrivibrio sp. YE44]